jgi:hypothetical protein
MNPTKITLRIRTEPPVAVGELIAAVEASKGAPQADQEAALNQFKDRLIFEVSRQ